MIPYRLNPLGVNEFIPLTLMALADSSKVTLNATGSPTVSGLQYRKRGEQWSSYPIGTEIQLNANQYVQFRNTADSLSSSTSNYVKFSLTGQVSAFGELISMLNNGGACKTLCFVSLFASNSALYSCRDLKFPKTVANSCFQSMFQWCQYLYRGPRILPATNLSEGCYGYMFQGCQHLEYMPEIPATTPARWAYRYMFNYGGQWNANGMTTTPIRFTTLADYCCNNMFQNAKISRLEVDFTAWITDGTTNWVDGVPASGTFVKPLALDGDNPGASRIPSGWNIVNK